MATFSKHGFNAAKYLAYRPIYNQAAYTQIMAEHQGGLTTAVDIGCGPGTVVVELAKRFDKVIGIDPSNSMIKVAQQVTEQQGLVNITFKQGYGESLPLYDQSVDLITVAQTLHWLDSARFLSEVIRVLRPRGTLIAWGYMFGNIRGKGNLLAQLGDPDKGGVLGPYWEQNRAIATAGFVSWLPAFQSMFTSVKHGSYPDRLLPCSVEMKVPWMDDTEITLEQLILYVKTWSSYRNWLDQQQEGDDGDDVVDAFFRDRYPSATMGDLVHVQWPHSVFIVSDPRIPYPSSF
ncbi:S-adenosyl-L-methionine-dependent methyltransferase [Chlamydoabsidia padenii]|nr:S-adenosyl-L-methionine-dependent methyltransferase [Chlamydoabsidia padenii]